MKCPFCGHAETQVKDSRPAEDNASIRRRRFCPVCGGRFTTFERVQLREITVVKASGRREAFDREKISRSLQIALRKRPFDDERIEQITSSIVRQLESQSEGDVTSRQIGERIMAALAQLDSVGYVRFASVYRDFRAARDFEEFLGHLPPADPATENDDLP
jgi:transcriptional repressor NrdR